MTATSPAEWAAAGSLGLSAISLIRLALAFADADAAYFDPRPVVRRVLAAAYQAAVHAGHDLNWVAASVWHEARPAAVYALASCRVAVHALAEFGRDTAALLILLLTSPKGHLA